MVGQSNKKAATAKLERLISCALAVFINRPQVTNLNRRLSKYTLYKPQGQIQKCVKFLE